ncbi:MAG: YlmH/Sll1252 family protein, partial [Bacillota bacterium]|nr:YlmH/Sll1252 family protein [Bacillota bacterium]
RREKLGDVVAEENGAFLVVDDQVADHVRTQLEQVGRAPVSVNYSTLAELAKWRPRYQSSTCIAASARLDAVTAAVYNLSRSEASTLVERGHVKLNHVACTSGSKDIKPGDLLSARGYGRAYVREFVSVTQKDRLRLRIERPL